MVGFKKWIKSKLDSNPKGSGRGRQVEREQPTHQEPLPFLPATRPRQLTPGPPHEGEDENRDSQRLLRNYGLFGRVPAEVRRQILLEAFGARTLHMDLSYGHPLVRKSRIPGTSGSNPRPAAAAEAPSHRHCALGSELVPDTDRPQGWQWFSCVCHRRAGYSETEMEQRYAAMEFSNSVEPCDDECLTGSESMCSCAGQPGSDGAACFVGAMGWLLACRQAYADGIGILYGTNTFHISSLELQLNLPRLLPRHHLESVTSLELLWKLNTIDGSKTPAKDHVKSLWDSGPNRQDQSDSPLHVLCATIPQTFPHVRSLYISFQSWLDPGIPRGGPDGDVISEVETIFLGPVEDMMRTCLKRPEQGPGRGNMELNVAIQRGAWRVLLAKYQKLLGAKLKLETVDELSRGRFWKALGSGTGGDAGSENEDDEFGYWICGGWEDMRSFGHDYWIMTNWGDKWTGTRDTF
ncbi:hypothetical protein EsH8_V_001113 [Colletotrichum jinshuiense]